MCVCVCEWCLNTQTHTHIYIYIYIERERERELCISKYISKYGRLKKKKIGRKKKKQGKERFSNKPSFFYLRLHPTIALTGLPKQNVSHFVVGVRLKIREKKNAKRIYIPLSSFSSVYLIGWIGTQTNFSLVSLAMQMPICACNGNYSTCAPTSASSRVGFDIRSIL